VIDFPGRNHKTRIELNRGCNCSIGYVSDPFPLFAPRDPPEPCQQRLAYSYPVHCILPAGSIPFRGPAKPRNGPNPKKGQTQKWPKTPHFRASPRPLIKALVINNRLFGAIFIRKSYASQNGGRPLVLAPPAPSPPARPPPRTPKMAPRAPRTPGFGPDPGFWPISRSGRSRVYGICNYTTYRSVTMSASTAVLYVREQSLGRGNIRQPRSRPNKKGT